MTDNADQGCRPRTVNVMPDRKGSDAPRVMRVVREIFPATVRQTGKIDVDTFSCTGFRAEQG